MMSNPKIGVLGAGAWGTALAALLYDKAGRTASKDSDVEAATLTQAPPIWVREADVCASLDAGAGNPVYLPGIDLPAMNAATELQHLQACEIILSVVPAQFARQTFASLAPHLRPGTVFVLCSKGIERGSLSLMTDVLKETLPETIPAVLSGPSFAADVARGLPTAITLACEEEALGHTLMQALGHHTFRPYWTADLIGAEVGGAVKNVLAIACGIVEGLGLGKSAHAALIARGYAEMTRLAVALGGEAETLRGLCGLGDLVLTCSSPQSRNMSFGLALGQGQSPEDILAARQSVTEGVATSPALMQLASQHGVEMPICAAVEAILSGQSDLQQAIQDLMTRPYKGE